MALVNTLVVRFRIYAPNGASRGILPHPLSWEAGIPYNDMPSLTLTYPDGSDAANLLKSPCEVALELRDPVTGTFTEHPGCRFLNIRRATDLSDRPRILSFTMPSYGWMLKKVRFLDPDNPRLNKEGQVVYRAVHTPAQPLVDIVELAKARGNVPGLTIPFTPFLDTNGDGWPDAVRGLSFDYGQDAWSILDSMSKQGYFDWRMNKRALELYSPNKILKRMLDTDTGVHIHSMLGMTEEPVERTWEEIAGTLVAVGDKGVTSGMVVLPDDPANFPWGMWDEMISASGVSDVQMLAQITDRLLESKYKSRTQYTKKFSWTEGSPIPLVDYRPGDFIRAMSDATTGAQKASMRVYQITLSGQDPYGVGISLTLNDRFTDRALQVDRWVSRVTGGGGPVGGGGTGAGGTRPQPPIDSTPPKAPVLTAVSNDPYFNELGEPVSMADVAFKVVTQDINDRSIDVVRYNVAARRADFNWQQARTVIVAQPDSPSTGQVIHAKVPLLDSGHSYEFRVQAIRLSGYTSDWSNAISQTMAYATEAPEVPSEPILSSKLSTIKAEWDGNDSTGAAYPPEFREVQVEASKNQTTWFHVGDIFSPGSSVIMSGKGGALTWNVGETVYVRFRARNSASVISQPSDASSITVVGVTGPDIAANTVTANNVVAGTLTAEQMKAHSLSVDRLAVGDTANMIADPLFYDTASLNPYRLQKANEATTPAASTWSISNGRAVLTAGSTANITGWFGLYNHINPLPSLSSSGPISSPGLAIPFTRPFNTTGGAGTLKGRMRFVIAGAALPGGASVSVGLAARFYDRNGTMLSNVFVISSASYTGATDVVIQSTTGVIAPVGTVGFIPYVFISTSGGVASGATISISEFEMWQESSVLIGDGMVKAPLVASNAITTDKLDADAITAKHSIRSAYYEMVSQSGLAVVKITENANYSGQSGIRWDGVSNYGPRIFQTDASGTGGWDPRGFVITGPEQTVNSSGRVDLQFAYGVGGSKVARAYGSETISTQGIFWDSSVARFRIGGMFNTSHFSNDMMRMDRVGFQNGTYSYGITTSRRYYPIITPNAGNTPATTSVVSFPNGTEGGFQYVSSSGTTEVFFIAVCGTP
jgi:flagellar hook assembly protein FlgD